MTTGLVLCVAGVGALALGVDMVAHASDAFDTALGVGLHVAFALMFCAGLLMVLP